MTDASAEWEAIAERLALVLSRNLMTDCPPAHREDVLSATCEAFVMAVDSGVEINNYRHYAGKTLKYKAADYFRSRERRERPLLPVISDVRGDIDANISLVETQADMRAALDLLRAADPDAYRALMSTAAEKRLREVASAEGVAISTIHARIKRGRSFVLRECRAEPSD